MTEHVASMTDACGSTTRGKFDDRLQALLLHTVLLPPFSQDERGIVNDEDVMIGNDIVENTIAGAFQQ